MDAITASAPAMAAGLGMGMSLIVAIGAQNAFVLRQGLRREHVGLVVAICAGSDLVLILAGVAGVGALVQRVPAAVEAIRWGGAAFLIGYGLLALRRAVVGGRLTADDGAPVPSRRATALTCLALTWLNPHVYLDTVLLLGSVATAQGSPERWVFGAGAMVASLVWFSALGFGARHLGRVFARPVAWRVLDLLIAVVMAALGIGLVAGG